MLIPLFMWCGMHELCNWLAMIKDGDMFLVAALLGEKPEPGSRSLV